MTRSPRSVLTPARLAAPSARARTVSWIAVVALAACSSTPPPARGGALPTPTPIPAGLPELRAALRARGYADSVYLAFQVEQTVRGAPGSVFPQYPAARKQVGVQGDVLAQFVVDTTGHAIPGSLNVLSSTDEQFAAAVRVALERMTFIPAQLRGRKVMQLVQWPFEFRLGR